MEILSLLSTAIKKPKAIGHLKPFFLLSHMRANTSLCGHILGSNPQIEGYYEMHKGYYSWKSLVRQRLNYYKDHPIKPEASYLFDKVLHDDHFVDMELLAKFNAKVMFSVREPLQTIKSTVSQFRKNSPEHEYCDIETVVNYYINRLKSLCEMSKNLSSYFFYDADELRENPENLLMELTNWLELDVPLSTKFNNFHFTGVGATGDLSGKLSLGKVDKKKSDYSSINIPLEMGQKAQDAYEEASKMLASASINSKAG